MISLLRGSRKLVFGSIAIAIAQALLLVPIAIVVREAFDSTIPDGDSAELAWMGALILGLFLGSSALALLNRRVTLSATKRAISDLRGRLLTKVYELPRVYYDRVRLGTLHSTIVQDSERLDFMSNTLLTTLLPGATIAGAMLVALFVLDPLLAAILVCALPLLVILGRPLGRAVRGRTRAFQSAFDVFSTETHLALRGITISKLLGVERNELERRRCEIEALADAGREMAWLQGAYSLLQTSIAAAAGVIVLVVGGAGVADGRISLGDLIAFYALLGLLRSQLTGIVFSLPFVISGVESMSRLEEILDEKVAEPYGGGRSIDFSGAIALEAVSFGYRGEKLLEEVDLELGAGEALVLLGPNGAGKSTILSLVAGLYAPNSGRILADGIPLADLDIAAFRRQLGVVLQDPLILPGTVRENIAFGRAEPGQGDIERAAELAGAAGFIAKLERGYDEPVGDDGELLSGGQRQRLALARALVGGPALLMLDEPSTHLDHDGTDALLERLRSVSDRPSVLMVSHDARVAREADRFHMLESATVGAL